MAGCVLKYIDFKCSMFFLFPGLEDEGFEVLEQLAYLYLANNKVSHTPDFQIFVLSTNVLQIAQPHTDTPMHT